MLVNHKRLVQDFEQHPHAHVQVVGTAHDARPARQRRQVRHRPVHTQMCGGGSCKEQPPPVPRAHLKGPVDCDRHEQGQGKNHLGRRRLQPPQSIPDGGDKRTDVGRRVRGVEEGHNVGAAGWQRRHGCALSDSRRRCEARLPPQRPEWMKHLEVVPHRRDALHRRPRVRKRVCAHAPVGPVPLHRLQPLPGVGDGVRKVHRHRAGEDVGRTGRRFVGGELRHHAGKEGLEHRAQLGDGQARRRRAAIDAALRFDGAVPRPPGVRRGEGPCRHGRRGLGRALAAWRKRPRAAGGEAQEEAHGGGGTACVGQVRSARRPGGGRRWGHHRGG
ncbi:hypothetical protein BU14_0535s0006 [Porphyra umbilicalis]|uniref:Uncharacterized protein n=1 Tax=Porphyra umbilicalis TaxID=2786 RepID=A0A1X6NS22_PORUM|nr:hypothetical protein BU14_0535s0006 [Porphyra umbilicalis]|eukprot:OSX71429.1 hypothetical protein BU14_0535s0006 [Porphyra umbilicalis]